MGLIGLDEFEAVAPGVVSEEAANAGDREVPLAGVPGGFQTLCEPIQVFHCEGWVGFFRWGEGRERLNADVELAGSKSEPTTFLVGKFGGTFEFRKAEEVHEEAARGGDTTGRRGELDMIEFEDTGHRGSDFHDGERAGFRVVFEYLAMLDVVDPAGDSQFSGFEARGDRWVSTKMFQLDHHVLFGDRLQLLVFGELFRHDAFSCIFAVDEPLFHAGEGVGLFGMPNGFHGATVSVPANDDVRDVEDFEGVLNTGGFAGVVPVIGRDEVAGVAVHE